MRDKGRMKRKGKSGKRRAARPDTRESTTGKSTEEAEERSSTRGFKRN
jgi:hypothetical protein